ncbi:hypothetical protein [Streptomyces sp. HB132]|uniref:hypothetical protein n=1 Tax=Streptomyces sp. HB132 TaxID=767388 RepID=UPI001960A427|nr:hypothetical protein [Streptomyces sp. HB132]MBM7441557.1 hypothetical protein [Streptomyces sp. HB132]
MRVTRGAVLKVPATAATVAALVLGPGLSAVAEPAPRMIAPEADVTHHGRVSLGEERIGIQLRTGNRGPSPLADATVRLRFSVPLAAWQRLPQGCLRGGSRTVLCATGPLRVGGPARRTALGLRFTGRPAEVAVRVDTVWNGGASDRNRKNDTQEVLALATGDPYVF